MVSAKDSKKKNFWKKNRDVQPLESRIRKVEHVRNNVCQLEETVSKRPCATLGSDENDGAGSLVLRFT